MYSVRMEERCEWRVQENFEGSGRGLSSFGYTEENYKIPQAV